MKNIYGFNNTLTKELKSCMKKGTIQITPDTEDTKMVYVTNSIFLLHMTIEAYNQYVLPAVLLPGNASVRLKNGRMDGEGMSIDALRRLFQNTWQPGNDLGVQIDRKDMQMRLIGNASIVAGINAKYYSMLDAFFDIGVCGELNPILFSLPMDQKALILPTRLEEYEKIAEAVRKAYYSTQEE